MGHVFLSAIEQSLLFIPFTLGVFISYRILRISDLTVDGTYVLGASIFAVSVTSGMDPFVSTFFSAFLGALVGVLVALIQEYLPISPLLVGILAAFMLYSINMQIMGQPNISLLNTPSIFSKMEGFFPSDQSHMASLFFIAFICVVGLSFLLHSQIGMKLRAFGENPLLLSVLSFRPIIYRMIGLGLANGLVALSGATMAQAGGFADCNMGIGMALIGITTVIISEKLYMALFRKQHAHSFFSIQLTLSIGGCFLYFLMLNIFQFMGINPINVNLLMGFVLLILMSMTKESSTNMR